MATDDDDRDDDRNRDRRGRGDKRRGDGRKPVALNERPNFVKDALNVFYGNLWNDIGASIYKGLPSEFRTKIQAVKDKIGATPTGAVFSTLATILIEGVQNADLPPTVSVALQKAIEDANDGMRAAVIYDKETGKEKAIDSVAFDKAAEAARSRFQDQLAKIDIKTWEQLVSFLPPSEHDKLVALLEGLNPEQRKHFGFYRPKLVAGGVNAVMAMNRVVAASTDDRSAALKKYLESLYGPPATVADTAAGLLSGVTGVIKRVDDAAKKVFGSPATGRDPVAEALDEMEKNANRRKGF